jgi:atonal protein 8
MAAQESTCDSLDLRLDTPPSDSDLKEERPRKNKRKMSEPRRLSDFSVKRFCPETDSRGSSPDPRYQGDCSSVDGEGQPDSPEPVNFVQSPDGDSEESLESPPSGAFPHGHLYQYPVPFPGAFHPYTAEMLHANQLNHERTPSSLLDRAGASSANSFSQDVLSEDGDRCGHKQRKNYKSMTIERRIEANARERTRVHTISAAFESLRRAVPSYSYNQKLSKLAILRIACCYILSLSRLAEKDYSRDQSRPPFSECVDLCTRTIQQEGKAKKRH